MTGRASPEAGSINVELKTPCPDCKASVPDCDGPTHAYIGASAGCWKIYGDILAKEYSDFRYGKVPRLTVDASAAQHPGKPDARAAQSVSVHLLALYLMLEKKLPHDFATKALGRIGEKKKHQFQWLTPPQFLGEITVVDVHGAKDATEHADSVHRWANSVWQAWSSHHEKISEMARET